MPTLGLIRVGIYADSRVRKFADSLEQLFGLRDVDDPAMPGSLELEVPAGLQPFKVTENCVLG